MPKVQRCDVKWRKKLENEYLAESWWKVWKAYEGRVGKRKLVNLKENIENESDSFKDFFAIRMRAEGIE